MHASRRPQITENLRVSEIGEPRDQKTENQFLGIKYHPENIVISSLCPDGLQESARPVMAWQVTNNYYYYNKHTSDGRGLGESTKRVHCFVL